VTDPAAGKAAESVVVERSESGIVSVTLNRPEKKNAIDFPMWQRLSEVFREVAQSPTDRVLVLTGAGRAFSGGADITSGSNDPRHQLDLMQYFNTTALSLHEIPKPTIAKVNGVAVGAGLNLALGCDLIVAGESARFSEIFAQRGLAIDMGGSWLLPRLVGMHKAKELALFGDILSDLTAGLVGGMGMAACAEIGDDTGLFQPAHGSAPDIMGQDRANPLAAILSGALMLEYLAQKTGRPSLTDAAELIDAAVYHGFQQQRIRPLEFGGDMGTRAVTRELLALL